MRDRRMTGRAGVLAAVLAAALAAAPRAEVVEEVAAFVNGQIVTRSELLEREAQVRAQLSRQLQGDEFEARFAEMRKTLLTDLIREVILLQRAEIMGLDLDKVYRSAVDNLKEQQGIKTNDEFNALLRQEGITESDLRRILLKYNVPDIMINLEVRQKMTVPPEDVKRYFDEHREEFRVQETYKFREIVLLFEGHTEEELAGLEEQVKTDLAGGLTFAEVVIKLSEAPSRFQEGLVGPMKPEDLSEEILTALKGLAPGAFAGPIRSRHGLHWVQLDAKTDAKEPDIDAVRSGIENKLKQQRFAEELEAYWVRLYAENRIVVKESYRASAEGIPKP